MYTPIAELDLLREFEDSVEDWYAPGFELREFGRDDSGYPLAADRLLTFAIATGSGSAYAVWLLDGRTDLATLPVVFLGDEGGINLVARDLREFFRVLASGWTPMGGWEGVEYFDEREDEYAEEDEGLCPANEEFRAWLRDHFRLEAAEDPNDIVDAAEAELWDRFAEWIGPLYPDVVNARTTEE